MQSVSQKIRTGLLELRTPNRLLYARPTFRERLYLLWIFRHFRSLSRQVLSHRQQQLIDRLAQTATALDRAHVARASIIGAVENVKMPAPVPAVVRPVVDNVIEMTASQSRISASAVGSDLAPAPRKPAPRPEREAKPVPPTSTRVSPIAVHKPQSVTTDAPRPAFPARYSVPPRKWIEWASGAALGVVLIGVLLYVTEVRPSSISSPSRPSAVTQQHAEPAAAITAPVVSPSSAPRTTAISAPAAPLSRVLSAGMPPRPDSVPAAPRIEHASPPIELSSTPRLQITGAPAHSFVYPEAPNSTLTGTVNLRAIIGPDGTVKHVDVLSGKSALARPAMEAVRHWRYLPSESAGQGREAETRVTINFVGDDAVSISFPPAQN